MTATSEASRTQPSAAVRRRLRLKVAAVVAVSLVAILLLALLTQKARSVAFDLGLEGSPVHVVTLVVDVVAVALMLAIPRIAQAVAPTRRRPVGRRRAQR